MSICVVFLPSIFRLISVVRGDEREDKDLVGHEFPWLSASIRSKMTTCDSASQACTRLSEYFAKELVMGVLSQVHVCQQAFIGARSNVRPQKSHYYSNNAFCSHDFYLFVWSLIWWCLRRPLMQVSPRPGPPASSTSYSARVILCCRISARGAACTWFKNSTTWIQNLWALHFWYQVATPFRLFGKFTERQKRKFWWGPDDIQLIHNDVRWL